MESVAFARYLTANVPDVFNVRRFVRWRSLQMTELGHFAEHSRSSLGGSHHFGWFAFVVVQVIAIVDWIRFAENRIAGFVERFGCAAWSLLVLAVVAVW